MDEKRLHKRFVVEGMELDGNMMFATEVTVLNISISGLSVSADRRMDIGREYTIKLRDHHAAIAVKALVVWSSLTGSREGPQGESVPVYSAGMKFTDVMTQHIAALIGYMEDQIGGPEHRLSGLRFHVAGPGNAVLQYPSRYRVKKISAGGMLIESVEALQAEEFYTMELSIPEESSIHFLGRVVSCTLSEAGGIGHFDIGIEFAGMGEDARGKLNDFLSMLNRMGEGF
ncbi:MAG: PilZ domain-containing protein [Nitrospiraceae bacterium]|nr:PilZ domain-containing protein [Nitrospiraceae bacterium]